MGRLKQDSLVYEPPEERDTRYDDPGKCERCAEIEWMREREAMTMTLNANPAILAALAAITKDLCEQGGIQKGRKNQQQGYAFRGIDQLLDGLAPLLAKHKVVISPVYGERTCEARATQKGGTFYSVTLTGEFTFRSAVDGSAIVVRTIGEAMDSADKATNKAMSAAFKYALTQTLCIPFEVEDADATTPEPTVPAEVTPPARRKTTAEEVEAAKRRSITGL